MTLHSTVRLWDGLSESRTTTPMLGGQMEVTFFSTLAKVTNRTATLRSPGGSKPGDPLGRSRQARRLASTACGIAGVNLSFI